MNSVATFWGLALFGVLVALALVVTPLWRGKSARHTAGRRGINIAVYRDQMRELENDRRNGLLDDAQYATTLAELEARLAQDAVEGGEDIEASGQSGKRLGVVIGVLLPLATLGVYLQLGDPDSIVPSAVAQTDPGMAGAPGGHDIGKLIEQVEAKTKANPNDAEAWAMLAKTYAAVEQWPKALQAYEKAYALRPDVPAIMTGYAEVLAITNNRVLQGKPIELIHKALELDPNDIKGLELAAIDAFQEKSYATAAHFFKRLHALVPPESPYAMDVAEAQKEAERLANTALTGLDNLNDQAAKPGKAANAMGRIGGTVEIAPALKAKIAANDTVFLFARAPGGGPPVAAIRATAGKLPLEFELTDELAMNPANKLSNFKEVALFARIAKSGDIKGAAGDLEGTLAKVKVGSQGVKLVIDQVRK